MHGDRTRVCLCHPLPVRSTRRVRCVPYRCFLTGTQDGAQATGLCAPLVCVCLTSYSRYIFNQPGDPIELAAQLDGSSPTSKECVLLSVLMLKSFRGVQPMITQFLQQLVMIPDNERPSSTLPSCLPVWRALIARQHGAPYVRLHRLGICNRGHSPASELTFLSSELTFLSLGTEITLSPLPVRAAHSGHARGISQRVFRAEY